MAVCDFGGSFFSTNFIDRDSCFTFLSYKLPQDIFVAGVEGNVHQIVIRYSHFDSTYAGYTLHNFDLRQEFQDIDDSHAPHVVPIGKTLIRIDRISMNITRQVPDYVLVKVSDLVDDQVNLIRVECSDDDSSKITNILNVSKMSNMRSLVSGNADFIPDFSVFSGSEFFF